jgi:hypothetical protein
MNLSPRRPTYIRDGERPGRHPGAGSNQKQIDQRDQGGPDAGSDQDVIGANVAMRIERWLARFLDHFGGLGQAHRIVCEADHIRRSFFGLRVCSRRFGARVYLEPMTDAGVGNSGEWVQAGTGNGPATSTMAIPERREAVALDAGRHHGKDVPPRSPLLALRSLRAREAARATRFAGIGPILFGLCPPRFRLRSAELGPGRRFLPASLAYSPANCSFGRVFRSTVRSLDSSRVI